MILMKLLIAKNDVFARITETSNDDYDNDVSDDCDFGVKNDQKVSHNKTVFLIRDVP